MLLAGCNNGTLTLSVGDAPIDRAASIVIKFTGVDVVETNDSAHSFTLDPPVSAELLSASGQEAKLVLLNKVTLPAGEYKSITLKVSAGTAGVDSFINIVSTASDSGTHPLTLLDSDVDLLTQSAVFRIERQHNIALTADFDLRRSVLKPKVSGDPYRLIPSVRIVHDDAVATVTGAVSSTFLTDAGCVPTDPVAVYVYKGTGVTPDDVGGTGTQPVSSAVVRQSAYTASFLDPSTYTAFVTCQALDDDADNNDDIHFLTTSREFTVTAGETETANFPQ
jgi:hypothetical protein